MNIAAPCFALLLIVASIAPGIAAAEPIQPGAIKVIDGDTIAVGGKTIRLIGFDTPEPESQARCEAERTLAARATQRLRRIVAGGGLRLTLAPCACKAGTEGTQACNYGRACAVLTAAGRDVATVLIAEGLARPYQCSRTRCPSREPWC